jgi:hypothetical protein
MHWEILLSAARMSAREIMHEKGTREVMMITIQNDRLVRNLLIEKIAKKIIEG